MFNKHVLKVIIGFTGMITLGLIALILIDSYKLQSQPEATVACGTTATRKC